MSQRLGGLLFLAMFTLVPGLFIAIGVSIILAERAELARAVPVPAQVVSTDAEGDTTGPASSSGSPGGAPSIAATGRQHVRYIYTYAGNDYEGTAVYATEVRLVGMPRSAEVMSRYPPGSSVTAWVNPEDPSRAFLERDVDVFGYLFAMLPMIFLTISAGVGPHLMAAGRPKTPVEEGGPGGVWYRLRALMSASGKVLHRALVLVPPSAMVVLGVFYLTEAWGDVDEIIWVMLGIGGAIWLGVLLALLHSVRALTRWGTPEAWLSVATARLGEPFRVRVRVGGEVSSPWGGGTPVKVVLTATETSRRGQSSSTRTGEPVPVVEKHVQSHDGPELVASVTIPPDRLPSAGRGPGSKCDWAVSVKVGEGWGRGHTTFPFIVQGE